MVNFGQAAVGIIVMIIVVGGLLYIFFSRTNAVQKTGYGSLIMLALVSLMIPVFWIMESGNQAAATRDQFEGQNQLGTYAGGVLQGMQLYAQYCTYNCYGIKNGKVVDAKYNGYTIDELNQMTDTDITRIISASIYNPKAPPLSNPNLVPKSDQYGGALLQPYVTYILDFIRSADPAYLKQNGLPLKNGFDMLPAYLQANDQAQYQAAVSYASFGQFGQPVDMTKDQSVTIDIVDVGKNGASCSSQVACFTPINVKVKVGTVITWVNKSSVGHTVTAITGTDTSKPAEQIFDSAHGSSSTLIPSGGKFTWTVTAAAYTFNSNHTVNYFCRIHPDMLGELTIVQ